MQNEEERGCAFGKWLDSGENFHARELVLELDFNARDVVPELVKRLES